MSKLVKIVFADAAIIVLYAAAFGVSRWLGVSFEDLFKLVPTAAASALGNVITLSLALNALLKRSPTFTIGHPEQDEWSVIMPLFVDCRAANGVILERLDVEGLDLATVLHEGICKQFPIPVPEGEVIELQARFVVLEGSKGEIVKRRKLYASCVHREEGGQRNFVVNQSCLNVFRRR